MEENNSKNSIDKQQKPSQEAEISASNPKNKTSNYPIWQMAIVAAIFFVIGFLFNAAGAKIQIGPNSQSKNTINLTKFWQVNNILQKKFDGEISAEKQADGATAGMVASLGDPYTTYLTAKENGELSDQLSGKLSGIGIEVGIKNNRLSVVAPIDGTPAQKAGLRAGDIIAAIDGQETSSMTIDEAVTKIRGEKGTSVKLTIVRPGSSPNDVTITRDNITVPSVSSEVKPGNIGYIKIRTFGNDTVSEVKNAANSLVEKGVKAVVVDVRDNPGGYLDGAVKISSEFVAKGTIVEERSKHDENKVLTALPGGQLTEVPVIMLINGGSASASEIMAGALHDNNRATLVGEKSFGKGSVQEVVCLNGTSAISLTEQCKTDALKVTVAHWFTPKGVNISKEGIVPDVEVKLTSEDYNAGRDPQLAKALELAAQK
jgi:carboxyl-terminal processing protease